MSTQTPEELKNEMIEKLGDEFGSYFYSMYNEIVWLTHKWIEFKELYGTRESRIELMNEVAPFFFFAIQKVLWENLLLGVTRITDPPRSMGKRNTTLRSLGGYLDSAEFKPEIETDVADLLEKSEFCRDRRNRWISHLDFDLAINRQNAKPLKLASRQKFGSVMEKIQSIYNKVSFKHFGSTVPFNLLDTNRGAISLLVGIENGLRYDDEVYKRKLDGTWRRDDFESRV